MLAVVLLGAAYAAAQTTPVIPGVSFNADQFGSVFNRGYDPVLLQAKEPIIDFHFDNQDVNFQQWAYPDAPTTGPATFSLPDETHVFYTPGSEFSKQHDTFFNKTQVEKYHGHAHGSALLAIVFNSASLKGKITLDAVVEAAGNAVGYSEHQVSLFKVNHYNTAVLSEQMKEGGNQYNSAFAKELRKLPSTYNSTADIKAHQRFLQKFGTHYVSAAEYGATLQLTAGVAASIAAEIGVEFDAQISLAFEFMLVAMGLQFNADLHTKMTFDARFEEYGFMILTGLGGDNALLANAQYDQYLNSVASNPVPTNMSYTEVHELCTDPNVAASLKQASADYIQLWSKADFPIRTCAGPAGTNLSIPQLPNAKTSKQQMAEYTKNAAADPIILPALKLAWVGRAFDAKTADTLDAVMPTMSFTKNQVWQDPVSGSQFKIPDGHLLSSMASFCVGAYESIIMGVDACAELYGKATFAWAHFEWEDPPIDIGGTFSHYEAGFSAQLKAYAQEMFMIEFSIDLFHLSRGISAPTSAAFQADVDALPSSMEAEAEMTAYSDFVKKWGTHFVGDQGFGGYCNVTIQWDQAAFASYDWGWKKTQATIKTNTWIDKTGIPNALLNFSAHSHKELDLEFDEKSVLTYQCTGGDPHILQQNKSWSKFTESVRKGPGPIERVMRLDPVSSLVEDYLKRNYLDTAIVSYVNNKKYDEELAISRRKRALQRELEEQQLFKQWAQEEEQQKAAAAEKTAEKTDEDVAGAIFPGWVPGVCNGIGHVGVGCGYDARKLDVNGLSINPKKPVIDMPGCKPLCYVGDICNNWWNADCEDCGYCNPFDPDTAYKVPDNVYVSDNTQAGGCFNMDASSDMEQYDQDITQKWEHSSGFIFTHHYSKTQEDFYHMYYKRDDSQSLGAEYIEYFDVTIADLIYQPTQEFKLALALLPKKYNYDKYKRFIDDFGTHFMDQASLGGMTLASTYFHSCFLEQYSGEYVKEQSSNSFLFIYNDKTIDVNGYNKTDKTFESWSNSAVKMVGGQAWKYLKLDKDSKLQPEDYQAWLKTILGVRMQPIQFNLVSILTLVSDATKHANLETAMKAMDIEESNLQENLVNVLKPDDPYCVPSWCKFDPHPPTASSSFGGEERATPKVCPNPTGYVEQVYEENLPKEKDPRSPYYVSERLKDIPSCSPMVDTMEIKLKYEKRKKARAARAAQEAASGK